MRAVWSAVLIGWGCSPGAAGLPVASDFAQSPVDTDAAVVDTALDSPEPGCDDCGGCCSGDT